VAWAEYVDGLEAGLRREGSGRSVAEAVDAAADVVARLVSGSNEGRHARVAAMRLGFAREHVGSNGAALVPADLDASALLSDALRLVAAAHEALRAAERPSDTPAVLLTQSRARVHLRAAHGALTREWADRLEVVAAR
jgi:hypothetical protein